MTHQEIELWTREIVEAVLKAQRIEDARIELKASWPDVGKAAHSLAAHANAARGTSILWLVGVDEKARKLANVDPMELANWIKSVERLFDGDPPRLDVDVNVRFGSNTVVALYFETHQGAPFVVEYTRGSYPQFVVPWREGTAKRAARREDLLRILVPIRRISSLVDELRFNLDLVEATKTIADLGSRFREAEFHRAISDGALAGLPPETRQAVTNAYLFVSRAAQLSESSIASSLPYGVRQSELSRAWEAVRDCSLPIRTALDAIHRIS